MNNGGADPGPDSSLHRGSRLHSPAGHAGRHSARQYRRMVVVRRLRGRSLGGHDGMGTDSGGLAHSPCRPCVAVALVPPPRVAMGFAQGGADTRPHLVMALNVAPPGMFILILHVFPLRFATASMRPIIW